MRARPQDRLRARRRGGCETPPTRRGPAIVGRRLPGIALPYAPDGEFDIGRFAQRFSLVVCLYPAVGSPLADETDAKRAAMWAHYESALAGTGHRLVMVSSDEPTDQLDWLEEEAPECVVLCDTELALARELGLPTTRREGRRVYQPATVVVRGGRIARVLHPVDSGDAALTTWWIAEQG
jgi:peroxiredoxin